MTFNETIQAVLNASSNHKAEQLLFSTIHTVPERAVMFYALKSRLDIAAAKDEELANKLDADETFSPELLDEAMQNQLVLSRLHFLFGRLFRDMELYGEPPAEFGDLKEAPDRFLSLLLVPFAPLWKDGSVNTEKLKNLLADEGAQNIQKFVASVNRSALESPDVLKTLSDEAQSLSFDDIHEFCELYLFNAVQELKAETTFDVSEPLEHDTISSLPDAQLFLDDYAFGFLWQDINLLLHELVGRPDFESRAKFVRTVIQEAYAKSGGILAPHREMVCGKALEKYEKEPSLSRYVLCFRHDAYIRALWHRHTA